MTDPIGRLDINNIDPGEDIRMTGAELIAYLVEERIDELESNRNLVGYDIGWIKLTSDEADDRIQELKSLIKEG